MAALAYRLLHSLQRFLCPLPAQLAPHPTPIYFPMFVYSHRGGREGAGPENTLPAFHASANIPGVDLLECDVQLTADGVVVVCHDRELGRLAGPAYKGVGVASLRFEDLPLVQPPPGAGPAPFPPAPMPKLEDLFNAFPNIPIQVDLKADTPGLVAAVHDLVLRSPGRRSKLLWGSFIHKVQVQLYETDPGIPLFTSAWRAILLRLAHMRGRMHEIPIYESAVIVPWRMKAPWGRGASWSPFMDRSWFEQLAARGVAAVVFGHDLVTPAAFQASLEAGARGVCTDAPTLLAQHLRSSEAAGAMKRLPPLAPPPPVNLAPAADAND